MDIHLWIGNGDSRIIQCILDLLGEPPFTLPEVILIRPAAHSQIHTAVCQLIYDHSALLGRKDCGILRQDLHNGFPGLADVCVIRNAYRDIYAPFRQCTHVQDTCIGQCPVGNNDHMIIGRGKLRIKYLNLFHGALMSLIVYLDIIIHSKGLQQKDQHTAGKI